ncbi:type IV pilus modification protein PilV [Variovorax sp. RHLX14]|uniref:type IV pilus modification protein PilV n=1 Tax=Variovorax sp. RHLX14 TaxID=1259731 RepID=UPI003F445758
MKRPGHANQSGHRQGGVALIEVLVSLLIFSLGILGLIGLQTRAITLSGDAEDRNRAALLANDVTSTMWLNRSVTLPAATLTAWQARVADAKKEGLPNGTGTVTVTANSADIAITWMPPSRTTQSRFSTRVTLP